MSVIVAASRKFGHAWWLVASTSAAGNCEGDAGRSWQDMQSVGVGRESPSDIGDGEGSTTERGTASARMSAPDSEACGKVAVVKSDGDNDGVVMWLIQDYLSSQGYEYALCTLACESGMTQEPFSARDVKQLLRLPHLDGQPVLEGIVARMLSQPETASAQTSVPAAADPRGGQDESLCAAAEVHAELKKLQQSVAEAEQRLLAVQQQLQSAQGEQAVAHLQAVRHMSVLTELSSVGSNCILEGSTPPTSSSRPTQSQRTRNSSVSSVFSLPLDRARRRLRQLSLQTDYLDDRLRAMRDDSLLSSMSTHDVSLASCEKSSEAHSFKAE
ncbi:uncharacterized protein LOC119169156 isoform X2 [Rhipicephalus microplus]|uniref:uncharacterized protein LOC119169156 isoform X2 n=1 Tax=Rhipicephalus microplus TaxID=6941 RepID=UPI003F6D3EA4